MAHDENKYLLWCFLWTTHSSDRPVSDIACSLHSSLAKGQEFCTNYWRNMPEHAPSTYLAPTGTRYLCRVDEKTHRRIVDSDIGLWCVTVPPSTTEALALLPPTDFMSLTEGRMPA